MPATTLNWLSATSRPRMAAGAISAMYIGATTDEPPMASPPMNRKTSSETQPGASPQPAAERRYSTASARSTGRRP